MPEASSFKYLGIITCNDLTGQIMSVTNYEKHGRHFISKCIFSKREII
jgi:hypothetical protein